MITGLPAATVHRLCGELMELGYLEKNPEGRYRIGLRIRELSLLTPPHFRDSTALRELRDRTGSAVCVSVLDGRDILYIDEVAGPSGSPLPRRPGTRLPALTTASGRILVAYLASDQQANHPAAADTGAGRASAIDLEAIRRAGVSDTVHESLPGCTEVAVPVAGTSMVAALSVFARSAVQDPLRLAPLLRSAAAELSQE